MKYNWIQFASFACLSALLASGCGAQEEPNYQGEALLRLSGTVDNSAGVDTSSGDLRVNVLWLDSNEERNGWGDLGPTRVRGVFPNQFEVDVLQAPATRKVRLEPIEHPETYVDTYVNTGLIGAITAEDEQRGKVFMRDVKGLSIKDFLVYFAKAGQVDRPEDYYIMQLAQRYNIQPTQGFHVVSYSVTLEAESAWLQCQFGNVCQHIRGHFTDPADDPRIQRLWDENFAKCQKYNPNAVSCTVYHNPESQAESHETTSCNNLRGAEAERKRAVDPTWPNNCVEPWLISENTGQPLTLVMDTTIESFINRNPPGTPTNTEPSPF